jgi:trans-aconitate 2-methyltransferase
MDETRDWDPGLYLKFERERTQPAIDLAYKIRIENPWRIADIGCGPGNSTRVLARRWPSALITGVDNSPSMLDRARAADPGRTWIIADARVYEPDAPFDIVFSNAALQWMPDHETLIPRLFGMVAAGGALAVQLPAFNRMPLGIAIRNIAGHPEWRERMAGGEAALTCLELAHYYAILARLSARVDLWETRYIHVMDDPGSIIEWSRGTGMRPFLDRLDGADERARFEKAVLGEIENDYPAMENGRVLFPFIRIFFIAYR